jgi:isopentenyl-diphosphate delta-isomerase
MTSRQIKATANIAISKNTEEVVLIDRNDQPLGTSPKATIHTSTTPLHRGFSVFIFNSLGQVLLQKRALSKITWPGIWSNSCCGHPALGESSTQAASRRLKYELGLELLASEIVVVLPKYRYRAELYGIVENEICPVMVAYSSSAVKANPDEVAETKWLDWRDFMNVLSKPNNFSAWCNEESRLLDENIEFQEFLKKIKT